MGGLCNHALELTGPTGNLGSRVHRLDPRAKIIGLVTVTLVAVSAPLDRWPAYVACAAVLAAYAAAAGVSPRELWRRLRFVLLLVLAVGVLVPFVRTGGARYDLGLLDAHQAGLEIFGALAAKAIIGTTSAALLGATTTFPAVLRGLEVLRVPRLLVLIAAFMYRYLFVIVEELARMRSALVSRGYKPRTALQAGAMGRVAGAMFLRTYGRGERVYLAMLARGYNGTMPQRVPLRLVRLDVAFVVGVALIVLTARLTAGA